MVAKSVILHIDTDQVIETRSWEAEDARDFLGMEKVGGLVPVDPHAAEVVAQKVVQRIPRKKAQAVRNPVSLARSVVVIRLGPLAELTDGIGTLFISTRPDAKCNAVESVR